MTFVPQNFVDNVGPEVDATWLNGVDQTVNNGLQGAQTTEEIQAVLGISSPVNYPIPINEGGTAATTAAQGLANLGGTTLTAVNQAYIGSQLYRQTAAEIAAGVTPVLLYYPPGDLRRYGGVADSGVTNNTVPLQNTLNANAGYFAVQIVNGGTGYYGGIAGTVGVPAGSQIIGYGKPELRWASTTATGPTIGGVSTRPGFNITGNNVSITGLVITGPSGAGVFTASEVGIVSVGTSAVAPITGINIVSNEIRWWGSDGIELKWCSRIARQNNYIHDCGYAGTHFLSCTNIVDIGNEVGPISPGASGNAYGTSYSWDAVGGTNSGSRADNNHYCIGIECSGNFIHDIPVWTGIDAHGLFDGNIHDNKVYNCWTGIQVATGSATTPPGENNVISNNEVNISQYNGAATTVVVANPVGITVNGISGSLHLGVRVIGNLIEGYGSTTPGYSIQATFVDEIIIAGNILRSWSGYGIYSGAGNGGVIEGNVFAGLGSSYIDDSCIYIANAATPWHIIGNFHRPSTGSTAHFGTSVNTTLITGMFYGENDFAACQTAAYGNTVGGTLTAGYFLSDQRPLALAQGIGLFGNTPQAQVTGFGTPVGGSVIANYNITDAGGANSNTNKCVAEILTILKARGDIGA